MFIVDEESFVLFFYLDCPEEVSAFIGSPGLMVIGRIDPPLEGVTVTIQTEEEGVIRVTTNSQGQYRYVCVQYVKWLILMMSTLIA